MARQRRTGTLPGLLARMEEPKADVIRAAAKKAGQTLGEYVWELQQQKKPHNKNARNGVLRAPPSPRAASQGNMRAE